MTDAVRWDEAKSQQLQERRGISFDRTAELDEEEQQIEDEIDQYVPADVETEATVQRIAQESKKRKNVNIRISERDLAQIRNRASREGVLYQTLDLIGSSGPK